MTQHELSMLQVIGSLAVAGVAIFLIVKRRFDDPTPPSARTKGRDRRLAIGLAIGIALVMLGLIVLFG